MAGLKLYSADDVTLLPNRASLPAFTTVDDSFYQVTACTYATPFVIGNEVYKGSFQNVLDNVGNPDYGANVCTDRFGNTYPQESYEGAKELRRIDTEKADCENAEAMKEYSKRFKYEALAGEKPLDFVNRIEQKGNNICEASTIDARLTENILSEELIAEPKYTDSMPHITQMLEASAKANNAEVMNNLITKLRDSAETNDDHATHDLLPMLRFANDTLCLTSMSETATQDFSLAAQIPIEAAAMQPSSSQKKDDFDFLAALNGEKEKQAVMPVQNSSDVSFESPTESTPQTSPESLVSIDTPDHHLATPVGSLTEHSNPLPDILAGEEELFRSPNSTVKVLLPGSERSISFADSGYTSGIKSMQRVNVPLKKIDTVNVNHSSSPSKFARAKSPSSTISTKSDPQYVSRHALDHYHASASRLTNQLKRRDQEIAALLAQMKEKDTQIENLQSELATYELDGPYIGEKGVTNEYRETYVRNREETLEQEKQEELEEAQEVHKEELRVRTSVLNKRWTRAKEKNAKVEKESQALVKEKSALAVENHHLDTENAKIWQQLEEVNRDRTDLRSQIIDFKSQIVGLRSQANNLLQKANHNRPVINNTHDQQQIQGLRRANAAASTKINELEQKTKVQDAEYRAAQEWINGRAVATGVIDIVCSGIPGCTCASCHLKALNALKEEILRLKQVNQILEGNVIPQASACQNIPGCDCQKCLCLYYLRIYRDQDIMIKTQGEQLDHFVLEQRELAKLAQGGQCNGTLKCRCNWLVAQFLAALDRRPDGELEDAREVVRLHGVVGWTQARTAALNNEVNRMKAELAFKFHGARFGACFGTQDCRCLDCLRRTVDAVYDSRGKGSEQQRQQLDQAMSMRDHFQQSANQLQAEVKAVREELQTVQGKLRTVELEKGVIEAKFKFATMSDTAEWERNQQQLRQTREQYTDAYNDKVRIAEERDTLKREKATLEPLRKNELSTRNWLIESHGKLRHIINHDLQSRAEGSSDDLIQALSQHIQLTSQDNDDLLALLIETQDLSSSLHNQFTAAESSRHAERLADLDSQARLDTLEEQKKTLSNQVTAVTHAYDDLEAAQPDLHLLRDHFWTQQRRVELAFRSAYDALGPHTSSSSSTAAPAAWQELLQAAADAIRHEAERFAPIYRRDAEQRQAIAELTSRARNAEGLIAPLMAHRDGWWRVDVQQRDRIAELEAFIRGFGQEPPVWEVEFEDPMKQLPEEYGDPHYWGRIAKGKGKAKGVGEG